jgi:hypothetical protein
LSGPWQALYHYCAHQLWLRNERNFKLNAKCLFFLFLMSNSSPKRPLKSNGPKMLDRNLDFDVFDISSCISDSDRMHIMVCQSTKITSARNNIFKEENQGPGTDIFFKSERIERFVEAQAFLRSYDPAPRPPPSPPPFPGSKLDWRHTGRLRKRDNLLMGAGVKTNNATARKPGPL